MPSRPRLDGEIEGGLEALYRWVADSSAADDLRRPDISDPALLARAALINRLLQPTFMCDQTMMAWLTLETLRMWSEHGPARVLLGPIGHVTMVTAARRHDYRTGDQVLRRILAVGEARGYEPQASQVRFLRALSTDHWFQPLEQNASLALSARERLIQGGDLQCACWTYYLTVSQFLDCAPALDSYVLEVNSALTFASRTGNSAAAEVYSAHRRLVSVLRGEMIEPAADDAASHSTAGGERGCRRQRPHHPGARRRPARRPGRVGPAIGGRDAACCASSKPRIRLRSHILLRALALTTQLRAAAPVERGALLAELDTAIDWLAARAADAPANFRHLLRLAEAERAWAVDDFRGAACAFDAAQREAAARQRPWHRALIVERAARFYLAHGMEHVGYALLAEARHEYDAWGATREGRPARLGLSDAADRHRRGKRASIDSQSIDPPAGPASRPARSTCCGILAASQALSSETSLDGLRPGSSTCSAR